ncbi:DUF5955 family protein [Nonomuraea sp. SBT364]|uniref:DUF5955 family protein n=1 Tax=Nonomuraea sp. SBT364 TaxID=1580530 RepID=UPI00066EA535|nr:DUF5955 family protein [Nonomuraea sp. SBT364]
MAGESFRFGNVSGPVNAGSGNLNMHGHQQVAGRDLHAGAADPGVRADLDVLRRALGELRLTSSERHGAESELAALEQEAGQPEPDRERMGQHLGAFTSALERAGALAGAGVTVIQAIGGIATWLGPAGRQVLSFLGL